MTSNTLQDIYNAHYQTITTSNTPQSFYYTTSSWPTWKVDCCEDRVIEELRQERDEAVKKLEMLGYCVDGEVVPDVNMIDRQEAINTLTFWKVAHLLSEDDINILDKVIDELSRMSPARK